ncbi:MAG: ABC transporter permease [Acidobacteria bacterium]|nr:ABC transporter permease [Acidobacteriota bacterium]
MYTFGRDIAVAWRRLRATPAFSFFAVVTLALGIAAVTSSWVMIRAVAAPPPGVPDVHQLVTVSHRAYGNTGMVTFSLPDFEDLRRRQATMSEVVAFATMPQVLAVEGQSYTSLGEVVSGNYFGVLRVGAALGRVIQPSDDRPGAPLVAVISHEVWRRVFGGRADVIGRTVMLGGHRFEIVGVAARDFVGLFANGRYPVMSWVPLASAHLFERLAFERRRDDRDERWLHVRARPAIGSGIDQIAAEVAAIGRQLDQTDPIGTRITDARFRIPYRISRDWVARFSKDLLMDEAVSYNGPPLIVLLMSSVGLVLLVSCTNLANLILARASVRREERAVRLALGASRWQLVLCCMGEAVIITAAGLALALGITWGLVETLSGPFQTFRDIAFTLQPVLGLGAIGVSTAAALIALIVAGVIPAVVLTGRDAASALMTGVTPTVVARWRVRRTLIAGQVAVSIVLLTAAAAFLGQVAARTGADSGIDLDRLAVAEVDLSLQNYDAERTLGLIARVLDRLNAHAGIEAAAVSSGLPVGPPAPSASVRVGAVNVYVKAIGVTPKFFTATGLNVVHGTGLDRATASNGTPPIVIDTGLAGQMFGRTDVVGQQVEITLQATGEVGQPATRTIVGVAQATRDDSVARRHAVYLPLEGRPSFPLLFSARTFSDPARIAQEMRAALVSADPHLGVSLAGSARSALAPAPSFEALAGTVASTLGGIGLTVVLAGLYGVLSYLVSRRTREIGMRLALGATPAQVRRMVIGEGLVPVVVGMILGAVVALIVRQAFVTQIRFDASAPGLALMAFVPVLILIATAIACYFPARRASRIEPATALKQ